MRLGLGCIALGLTLLTSCADERAPAAHTAEPQPPPAQTEAPPKTTQSARPVQIEMRNVQLHVDDGIVLAIERLRGEMISKSPGRPPVFDDGRSYVLKVSSATMSSICRASAH